MIPKTPRKFETNVCRVCTRAKVDASHPVQNRLGVCPYCLDLLKMSANGGHTWNGSPIESCVGCGETIIVGVDPLECKCDEDPPAYSGLDLSEEKDFMGGIMLENVLTAASREMAREEDKKFLSLVETLIKLGETP